MKWSLLALAMTAVAPLTARSGDGEVGGYVKYLFSRSDFPAEGILYDHLLHARLNTKWYPIGDVTGVLELRGRVYYGTSVEKTPGFADQLGHDAGFGRLGSILWNSGKSVGYVEADRLSVNWEPGHMQVTAGRQRIAWGTNLVWNPIDLFNPQSVLDFDYEERPAVDALRLQYYTGEVSKVELAVKPGSTSSKTITAIQWTTNRWDYDFHFLGGWRSHEWFAGTGWAGDILGGGFRGEALASEIPPQFRTAPSRRLMFSFALSGDYTFPNSLYIHTEGLYNSEGTMSDAALFRRQAAALGLLSPGRWSVFQELAYDVSPLIRADAFAMHNLTDGSTAFVPSLTWSVVTNLDVSFIALLFSGAPLTEYGGLGTAAYVRGKWSF